MMTDQDKIAHALNMWGNHIETGDFCLSAADAAVQRMKLRPITGEQVDHVRRLRELATLAAQGRIQIDSVEREGHS